MAELQPIMVFHGRHFVHYLGICNPICVKLLQIMSGVIKRKTTSISNRFPGVHKHGIHTQTDIQTHTHDDSIRRNAMRCISPENDDQSRESSKGRRATHSLRYSTALHNSRADTPWSSSSCEIHERRGRSAGRLQPLPGLVRCG